MRYTEHKIAYIYNIHCSYNQTVFVNAEKDILSDLFPQRRVFTALWLTLQLLTFYKPEQSFKERNTLDRATFYLRCPTVSHFMSQNK